MIAVADTSVINYLVQIGRVEILPALYGRVKIAHAVRDELFADAAPPDVRAWASAYIDWVDWRSGSNLDIPLPYRLGAGERETINVALNLDADVVLMDDLAGRLAAESLGLFVSGTLAVLLQASRVGLLDFTGSLAELKNLGFRVSVQVEARMAHLSRPT